MEVVPEAEKAGSASWCIVREASHDKDSEEPRKNELSAIADGSADAASTAEVPQAGVDARVRGGQQRGALRLRDAGDLAAPQQPSPPAPQTLPAQLYRRWRGRGGRGERRA